MPSNSPEDQRAADKPVAESGAARTPQPWHAADEKPASSRTGGAPIGTHSFTGNSANVGMPKAPQADDGAERSEPRNESAAEAPDPLAEPRANVGEILGRKPSKG